MIRLLAHAAPPGCLDVWLGVAEQASVEPPRFTLDGEPVDPTELRPLEAVRIGAAAPPEGRARTFTGGYRFAVEDTDEHVITVQCGEERTELRTRAVPTDLPEDRWFNVLLGSCYDRNMERSPNLVNRAVQKLCQDPSTRPDVALYMGDQVYLDVPPTDVIGRFGEPGLAGITAQFEADYTLNWMTHLGDVLSAAPFVCVPDDHEFWNNYPTQVAWLPRTLSTTGRAEWEQAARRCYLAFQQPLQACRDDGGAPEPVVIDVGPLSIFCLDTRTWRLNDRSRCALPEHLEALRAWSKRVHEQERLPVFMTGQTLFKSAQPALKGWLTDFELSNYGDYVDILEALYDAGSPDRPTLCLTGDVHFGRVVQAVDDKGRPRMYEIISSPMSLCSDPRSAHQPLLSQLFHRFFGQAWLQDNRPWPRHPRPALARPTLPVRKDGSIKLRCHQRYSHLGNHVAILGFRQGSRKDRIQCRVGYVTLVADERRWEPIWVGPWDLRNGVDLFGAFGSVLGQLTGGIAG